MSIDSSTEKVFLAVAHALYMNRLHLLRLTEVVRLGIRPDPDDGNMQVPDEVDQELRQQAIDFVITCFPSEMSVVIAEAKHEWLQLA